MADGLVFGFGGGGKEDISSIGPFPVGADTGGFSGDAAEAAGGSEMAVCAGATAGGATGTTAGGATGATAGAIAGLAIGTGATVDKVDGDEAGGTELWRDGKGGCGTDAALDGCEDFCCPALYGLGGGAKLAGTFGSYLPDILFRKTSGPAAGAATGASVVGTAVGDGTGGTSVSWFLAEVVPMVDGVVFGGGAGEDDA